MLGRSRQFYSKSAWFVQKFILLVPNILIFQLALMEANTDLNGGQRRPRSSSWRRNFLEYFPEGHRQLLEVSNDRVNQSQIEADQIFQPPSSEIQIWQFS